MRLAPVALLVIAIGNSPAGAQSVPPSKQSASAPVRGPSLELSLEAARTAIDTCAARDQKIGVTIIDAAGTTKVTLGSDGASARGVSSSNSKAQTAFNFKAATSALTERAQNDKSLTDAVAANPAFNIRPGGVPIKVGADIIGAIGVGGARGSDIDEACALAGLQKIQDRLK